MIDNIKFFVTNKDEFEQNVCKKANIDFKAPYNTITGEAMEYPKRGKYYNLDVVITEKGSYVNGSLHKFHNSMNRGEEQNYNDFNFEDLKEVIDNIENTLGINPESTKITNLEFGFNINTDLNPEDIINNNVMMFNHLSPNRDEKFRGHGDFKEFQKTDYSVKIYNKSKQYQREENILRVEVKIIKSRVLERFGLFNLNDLIDKEKMKLIFDFYIDKIKRLQIIDDFEHKEYISKKDKDKLIKFTSPFLWKRILIKPSNIKTIYVNEFEKLIDKYNLRTTRTEILDKINKKFKQLLRLE